MKQLQALSLARKLVLGGGVLLLIDTFLSWQSISFQGVELASRNAWHGFWGVLLGLMTVALVAWVIARMFGVETPEGVPEGLISLALGVADPRVRRAEDPDRRLLGMGELRRHRPGRGRRLRRVAQLRGEWRVAAEHAEDVERRRPYHERSADASAHRRAADAPPPPPAEGDSPPPANTDPT